MSAIEEVRRRNYRDPDITPHTAGAEEPETSPEQILGMVHNVFGLGFERKRELDELNAVDYLRDGTYSIKYAHNGQYADFHDKANYEYLQKKYPFLHSVSEGLGFDEDKGVDSHGTFEDFLASIPHEDWTAFLEDMDSLDSYPLLDEDRASELEMEEGTRWVTEDGGPDLIKTMRDDVDDAYEGYLLNKVTIDMIFEWMRETDHYPEAQGQGDVWMKMEELGKERETQEWFLEQLDDDVDGWNGAKRAQFDDQAGAMLDGVVRTLAQTDEAIAHVYNQLDEEALWKIFADVFPDERRKAEDPYWYFWKPHYNEPGLWRVGYKADSHNLDDWKRGLADALSHLQEQEWFIKLLRGWFHRAPEGHPEFKFEALEAEPDPDDPETFVRYGGGLSEDKIYEDGKIIVMTPRDFHTLNYHLRRAGLREIDKTNWMDLFRYNDVFVVLGKEAPDLLGKVQKRVLAILRGNNNGIAVYTGSSTASQPKLADLLKDPEYGKNLRRMLLAYYREQSQSDAKAGHVLMQLGGVAELRRAERHGHLNLKEFSIPVGLHYIQRHKYGLAAKALNRSIKTITPKGVWLVYDSVEDLTSVFKNESAASTVFANDHHDWFDNYYAKSNRPDVSDVVPFLDKSAIDHIREVMANRRVWFPDAGPEGRGEWIVLKAKDLPQYDDDTILDWLARPSDEDKESFEDIIEAIQLAGVDILLAASQDSVYTGFVNAAVKAIDGTEHKWTHHPSKKNVKGEAMDAFMVFVPWTYVEGWSENWQQEHDYAYDGTLESLAIDANADQADPNPEHMEAGWRDVNKDYAKDQLDRIHELQPPEPPEPIPGEPNYVDPAQMELPIKENEDEEIERLKREYNVAEPDYDLPAAEASAEKIGSSQDVAKAAARAYLKNRKPALEGIDDPEAMPDLLSGVPVEFERRVKAILTDSMAEHNYTVRDLKFEILPSQEYSDEDIDASDGRIYNRPPHRFLIISYLPEPVPDHGVTSWVFRKVQQTAVNVFKNLNVSDCWIINPETLPEALPANLTMFQFSLYDRPQAAEPPDQGEVPF